MGSNRNSKSIFVAILFIAFAVLLFIFEDVFGGVLASAIVSAGAKLFGWELTVMMATVSVYAIPSAVILALFAIVYVAANWHLRNTIFVDDPSQPAALLPQMTGTEIAEYLRDKSAWGWRTYGKFNTRSFVQKFVPNEMERAGKSREVRYMGAWPNSQETHLVDPAYWHEAGIDEHRIWDNRNNFATYQKSPSNAASLKHFSAPRIDIYRAWPKVTIFGKISAKSWVFVKTTWCGAEDRVFKVRRWLCQKIKLWACGPKDESKS